MKTFIEWLYHKEDESFFYSYSIGNLSKRDIKIYKNYYKITTFSKILVYRCWIDKIGNIWFKDYTLKTEDLIILTTKPMRVCFYNKLLNIRKSLGVEENWELF